MHSIPGNPASFPATVGLVDDADLNPATASALDVAPTNLADRTAYLKARSLDKTGDTITGNVHVGNGATLEIDSGGTVQFDSGSQLTGTATLGTLHLNGAKLQLDAPNGIVCNSPTAINGGVAGAIRATIADGIQATTVGGISSNTAGGIKFGGGATDFGSFDAGRTKSYAFPLQPLNPNDLVGGNWTSSSGVLVGHASGVGTSLALVNPHRGAVLASISVNFRVPNVHASVPATLPSLSVWRMHLNPGGAPASPELLSTTDPEIFGILPEPHSAPANGVAWQAGGVQQTLTYVTNQNNVIDNANYVYFILLTDENGAGSVAGNVYTALIANYTNINDLRFPS